MNKVRGRRGTLTVGGLAWRQVRARWTSYAPTAVGLAVALALAAAVTFTQSRTEEASLGQTVSQLGARGLITVKYTGVRQTADYDRFIADVKKTTKDLNGVVTQQSVLLYSGSWVPISVNGASVASLGPTFAHDAIPLEVASIDNVQSHVNLVAGTWPTTSRAGDILEVTVPEDAAKAARVSAGDRECIEVLGGNYSTCMHIAGVWRPRSVSDPYWGASQTVPNAAYTDVATYFSLLIGEATKDSTPLLESVATVTLSPDANTIRALGAPASLTVLRRLHGQLGERRPDQVVVSAVEAALNNYTEQQSVASFAVQLVAVQLLLVALYCVWFLAGNLLAQQLQVIAIWRSRGWSWRGVSLVLFTELGAVALVALPIGLVGGWLASEAAARFAYRDQSIPPFRLDVAALAGPIAAVLAAELLLLAGQSMLAARNDVLRARAAASRPPVAWWRRRYLDILLAVLAVPLLVQLRVLGSASVRATGAADSPINLVLPGIAMAFLAIAAVRLLPAVGFLLARARHTVAARLASLQLLRAPGQHVGLAILLMLAVAVGIFASTYAATAARNGADRAAYFTGSDVRGTFDGPVKALPDAVLIKGATARSAVFRGDAREGDEDVAMVAVDPYTFNRVAFTRADLAPSPLRDLVQLLADRETGGLLLPTSARTLSIWVYGSKTGGFLSANLSDANGLPVSAVFGALDFSGWKQLSAPLLNDPAASQSPPLRFRDLAIYGVAAPGAIALSSLTTGSTVIESFAEVVTGPGASQFPGYWWRSDPDTGQIADFVPPSLNLPRDGARTASFHVVPAAIPTYVRPALVNQPITGFATAVRGVVPALVPQQMLNRLGLSIGQTIGVEVDNVAVTAELVGVADHFPTMYPEQGDFMILARDPLLIALAFGRHGRPWPNEIWVRTSGNADAAVASLQATPGIVTVYDRRATQSAISHSPAQLELSSNLQLGFVAALALALLAFALHFLVLARARRGDYAVLEANGMSPATVRRSLVVEQVMLLAFSAIVGALLGVLASLVVLPALQLSGSAVENVPQTIVTFDWSALVLVAGVIAVGALAAAPAVAATERPQIMSELRSLG